MDAREIAWGTDPHNPDSDYDGITDGDEVDLLGGSTAGFSPISWDSDNDGYGDYDEIYADTRVHHPTVGNGSSYYDWDGDGIKNPQDSHPLNSSLASDWNNNGFNDETENAPTTDYDNDGYEGTDDSHPSDPLLWSDWNNNGINDDEEIGPTTDSDGDGYVDAIDSHPNDTTRWIDWNDNGVNDNEPAEDLDGDGVSNQSDSHPQDPDRWLDWNNNGISDDQPGEDRDGDGRTNESDSHPQDYTLWSDWNNNGINDDYEGTGDTDGDGVIDAVDSHQNDPTLWNDHNHNGFNDEIESLNSDADGTPDYLDSHPQDGTLWSDHDHDGLNSEDETVLGTNPALADTDGDGLNDGEETAYGCNPLVIDTDDDGLTDYEELVIYANIIVQGKHLAATNKHSITLLYLDSLMVNNTDTDSDGIPDVIENFYAPAMDPNNASDAQGDLDADGFTNLQEYQNGTRFNGNLIVYDYDQDGITDIEEDYWSAIQAGVLNKYWFNDAVADADNDGVLNFEEARLGLNPLSATTYGATSDLSWANTYQGTTWTATALIPGDTDGDGMPDLWEHRYRLDLRTAANAATDPDGDGKSNLQEFVTWRNPLIHDYHATVTGPAVPTDLSGGSSTNQPHIPTLPATLPTGISGHFNIVAPAGGEGGNASQYVTCEVFDAKWFDSEASYSGNKNFTAGVKVSAESEQARCFATVNGETQIDAYSYYYGHSNIMGGDCPCQHGKSRRFRLFSVDEFPPFQEPEHAEWNDNETCPDDPGAIVERAGAWMRIKVDTPVPPGEPIIEQAYAIIRDTNNNITSKETLYMAIAPGETVSDPISISLVGGQKGSLELDMSPDTNAQSLSVSDGGGTRYRKVGLNGFPMSDAKPQVQNENGEDNEETYIDAFSSQLRHSVTDVYVPEPGSLIPLSVRRDLTSDAWNWRSGTRAHERPDQPFGPCWSSNLCSYIRFEDLRKAEVIDEMGGRQTFHLYGHDSRGWSGVWLHDRQEARDQKARNNVLVTTSPGVAAVQTLGPGGTRFYDFRTYGQIKYKKKFGTVCTYQMIAPAELHQIIAGDRLRATGDTSKTSYARLAEVEDRWGNKLVYDYPDARSLIPSAIRDPQRPGHAIAIQQSGGRVTHIRQPGGSIIEYQYENAPGHIPAIPVLSRVVRGDSTVGYNYLHTSELDDESTYHTTHFHTELAQIRDERNLTYNFTYGMNASVSYWDGEVVKRSYGLPMLLTKSTSPMGGTLEIQTTRTIEPGSEVWMVNNQPEDTNKNGIFDLHEVYSQAAAPPFHTSFQWTQGSTKERAFSYTFSNAQVLLPTGHPEATSSPNSITYAFKTMVLKGLRPAVEDLEEASVPMEVFEFDPNHAMALKSVTDRNGHETSFGYSPSDQYDDPTSETNALLHQKTLTYDSDTRILSGTRDARGVKTTYALDGLGRRTEEKIVDTSDGDTLEGGSKKNWTFGHPQFPGFATQEAVDTPAARVAEDPSLVECPIVSTTWATDPDTNKVGWWRMITEKKTLNTAGIATPLESATLTVTDFNGNKRSVTDGRGHTTLFDYDNQNRLVQVTHPDGSSKSMAYDPHGNLIREQDETGVLTFHEYDALNRLTKSILDLNRNGLADGRYTQGGFDANGLPSYNGDIVSETTYNSLNLPVTVTDARGVKTTHDYDIMGRRTKTTVNSTAADPDARLVTEYTYQEADINGGKEAGSTVFDTGGFKPVKVKDPRGHFTEFNYDALYRLVSEKRPDDSVVYRTYNKGGQVTSVSDPAAPSWVPVYASGTENTPTLVQGATEPFVTCMTYDAMGQLTKTTFADGKSTQSSYTPSGTVWKTVDEAGAITLMHHDSAGLPVKIVQDEAISNQGMAETKTEYDAAGNAIKVTNPLGRTTQTVFDVRNRPVAVIMPWVHPQTPVHLTTYDPAGRVASTTTPAGAVTRTFYDAAGRAVQTFNALDKATRVTYDAGGNALSTINVLGQTVTNLYDALGRLLRTTDAENQSTYFAYDKAGNRILVVDGRATTVTPWSEAAAFAWAADWETGTPAPFSPYHTTFRYDALNRLLKQTFANGDFWSYQYNRSNTLKQKQDTGGRITTYTYDRRHRLDVTTGPNESLLVSDRTYDSDGRLQSVADKSPQLLTTGTTADTSAYTYDKLGRIVSETSYGRTHTYAYDLAGNRTQAHLSVSGTAPRKIKYGYDGLNRFRGLIDDNRTAGTGDDLVYDFAYHPNGQIELAFCLEWTTTTNNTLINLTQNEYDLLGRLITRRLYKRSATPSLNQLLSSFTWTYDDLGNVTSQTETWMKANGTVDRTRVTVMAYDQANRLIQETISDEAPTAIAPVTTAYTYDGASNRLTKHVTLGSGTVPVGIETGHWTYTYNAANQLSRWDKHSAPGGTVLAGAQLTYDNHGNRIKKVLEGTIAETARTTTYTWDDWDRLREAAVPTSATAKKAFRYTYDYRMRRIARSQSGGGLTTQHRAVVFSGGLSVAEFSRANNNATPATAASTVNYVRGPDMGGGVGGLLCSVRGTTLKFNHSNGRGDVVAQTGSTGALVWTGSYEAYGRTTKETGTNNDTQRANSKEEEEDTGLLNEGFRYRDLETGVWLSRDPAGFVDGPNLYAYCVQNPWTHFDADGLSIWSKLFKYVRKGGDFAATTVDIVSDFKTLGNAMSFGEAFPAALSIGSELLPVSGGDIKDAWKYGKKLLGKADDAKDAANKIENTARFEKQKEGAQQLDKVLEARKKAALDKPPHGNTAGDQEAVLYERYDKDGNFQKHGTTADPDKRYTKKELDGGDIIETDRGPRREILQKERQKVETNPGPLNKEPWAGKQSSASSPRLPPSKPPTRTTDE